MNYVDPIRSLSDIELVKNLLKLHNYRDFLLFTFGINSGLRISDILKLRVGDVREKNHLEIIEKKTGKLRKVLITSSIKQILKSYIVHKKDTDWLFNSRKGNTPITRVQAYRILKTVCNEAGLKASIGTHSLRKTFGYHLYKRTKDVALLQNILNHSNPNITLRYIGITQDIIDSQLKSFVL